MMAIPVGTEQDHIKVNHRTYYKTNIPVSPMNVRRLVEYCEREGKPTDTMESIVNRILDGFFHVEDDECG